LEKAQKRLARMDELRQAAKNEVEMRIEKEREELGTRVESRARQAEENRLRLLAAYTQKQASLRERTAHSLVQRLLRENRYIFSMCLHVFLLLFKDDKVQANI
jgi:hypothetical protein